MHSVFLVVCSVFLGCFECCFELCLVCFLVVFEWVWFVNKVGVMLL